MDIEYETKLPSFGRYIDISDTYVSNIDHLKYPKLPMIIYNIIEYLRKASPTKVNKLVNRIKYLTGLSLELDKTNIPPIIYVDNIVSYNNISYNNIANNNDFIIDYIDSKNLSPIQVLLKPRPTNTMTNINDISISMSGWIIILTSLDTD